MRRVPLARSASLRLSLAIAGLILFVALLAMAVQYRTAAGALARQQTELLQADFDRIAELHDQRRTPALRQAQGAPGGEALGAAMPGELLYLLQDGAGQTLAGNLADWPEALPPPEAGEAAPRVFALSADDGRYTGIARVLPGGFPLLVARADPVTGDTLAEMRGTIAWMALALLAMAALTGGFVSRLVLRRIDRVNALADRVAAGDLSARLPGVRSADEFGALEDHVHAMLDRIQNLNAATNRLSDSIAHELRTPLNRIAQKLDRLEGQPALVGEIRGELRGTIRIFDALLDISGALAEQGQRPGLAPLDLSRMAGEVFDLYEPVAEEAGLQCRCEVEAGLHILGDRSLLAQLISNLLDNAIKFCTPGDTITLRLTRQGARHLLEVSDTGPGVPEDIRADLFERFTRAERDRDKAGHGLGLALVQAIAARHGAKLDLPPRPKGFAIAIAFPKLDAELSDS
ncbi:HAMP domain-containing sensor histidine kinase [Marinovum sp.]|uniref:sensor histidine kinase n=1 Tax=Marinovum sp. TaxID=2024839 RepID=UPI002B26B629|nr:HAMP domain-containing sensor histidine kinase [Marinovum sp.]